MPVAPTLKEAVQAETKNIRAPNQVTIGETPAPAVGGSQGADSSAGAAQPVAAAPADQWTDSWPKYDPKRLELHEATGKRYSKMMWTNDPVNCGHSLEDLQEYMREVANNRLAPEEGMTRHVPHVAMQDFVSTISAASSANSKHFKWPSHSVGFRNIAAVGLDHLPPGYKMCFHNGNPVPQSFLKDDECSPGSQGAEGGGKDVSRPSGSQGAEGAGGERQPKQRRMESHGTFTEMRIDDSAPVHYTLQDDVVELYHGTDAANIPNIVGEGFRASFGSGSDALQSHFGFPIAGVYLAPTYEQAQWYPMQMTTGKVLLPGETEPQRYPGGTIIAGGGSYPLRAVFRVLVHRGDSVWRHPRANPTQYLFRVDSVHITHMFVYAVDPLLTHEYQLPYEPVKSFLWHGETTEQLTVRSHREIVEGVKFHCRESFDKTFRGGHNMTRGDALLKPTRRSEVDKYLEDPRLRAVSPALLSSVVESAAWEKDSHPLVAVVMGRLPRGCEGRYHDWEY